MTTLPSAGVKLAPEDSLEKKIYTFIDGLSNYMPIPNDRNRLSYCLFKYLNGEGDKPEILLKSTKVYFEGIEEKELAVLINSWLLKIK